ncbi:uncharacterized protein TNCV_1972851 [Trichonephila clavipes]|nr:uncharacterized protein TNCV_1972851 [Trichonephila clavipes]
MMNSISISLVATLFIIGFASALPNALPSVLENKPDTTLPEQTMMGQNLKDLDIEICPDKLHLCPGTAECCKKDDGKWDCCPKAAVPIAEKLRPLPQRKSRMRNMSVPWTNSIS